MFRNVMLAAVTAALVWAAPVEAKRAIRIFTPVEKLVRADVVVVGKVTAIEKEMVEAAPSPGVKEKQSYKVAVIKIDSAVVGAASVTHIKVGFIPPAPLDPNTPVRPGRPIPGRGGFQQVNLTEGMEGLFYLTKHHSGEFYTINPIMAPVEAKADGYKDQVALAKKGAAVFTDPMKALKSDKADERFFAANLLVQKYRSYPEGGVQVVSEKVPAEESKLILKALAAGSWKRDPNDPSAINGYQAFSQLGLNAKDGWKAPAAIPGMDYFEQMRGAFAKWLDGPGKDYQISKWVAKKK